MASERLQKLIARAGLASRRQAEQLVVDGRVRVNGGGAAGLLGGSGSGPIEVDGRPLRSPSRAIHLAVHKPPGFLSSAHDERGRRSVVALVDAGDERLWPAGRLDVESEGSMTPDQRRRLGEPRRPPPLRQPARVRGARHAAADARCAQAAARWRHARGWPGTAVWSAIRAAAPRGRARPRRGRCWLQVRIGEGRQREVRRLFHAVDASVERLVRTRIGSLSLGGLRSGQWRTSRPSEVAALAGERDAMTSRWPSTARRGPARARGGRSRRIGAIFVDTGLMYRALTLAALERGIDLEDGPVLAGLADTCRIEVERAGPERRRPGARPARRPRRHLRSSAAPKSTARSAPSAGTPRSARRCCPSSAPPPSAATWSWSAATLAPSSFRRHPEGLPHRDAEVRAARARGGDGDAGAARDVPRRDRAQRHGGLGRAVAPLRMAADALILDTGERDVDACVEAIVERLEAIGA